jgi:alpha-1,3-rhamnosyl/mannosyltransferase
MTGLRVGVDLCRIDPSALRPVDHAVLDTIEAAAAVGPDDVELVLFASRRLRAARPALFGAFEAHTLPFPPGVAPARLAAEATWLRAAVRRARVDLVHDAGGTSPTRPDVPTIVSVHDLAPFERPRGIGRLRVAHHRHVVPRAVEAASAVTVPSAFVRDRLVALFGVEEAKVHVVPWPLPPHEEPARIETVRARHGIIGQIVLLPGSTRAEQEQIVAVRAMRHLAARHETTLVLLGEQGPAETRVAAEIESLGLQDRVVRLGSVSPPVRSALYEHAAVVLHPAVYEGFADAVLEAMACGVPVVVAAAGAAPELVGDAGAVIPPGDDAQLAIEVHRVLDDAEWRRRMVAAGLEQARGHTAPRVAERLLAAYRSVLVSL